MNILDQEHLEEEDSETATVGKAPKEGDHDRDTYVTSNTEVHSSVFFDEVLGETIVEVTSSISDKNVRTQKRVGPLCTSFIVDDRPKQRKN